MKVKSCTGELSFDIAKVRVEGLYFFIDLIDSQDLYPVLLNGNKSVAVIVEEEDLIDDLFIRGAIKAFSRLNVPNNQHIPASEMKYLSYWHP